jgi:hypothetical protein
MGVMCSKCFLGKMLVVEPHGAVRRGFQGVDTVEVVGTQHVLEATVEALDHAIGLRRFPLSQPMLDAQRLARVMEFVLAASLPGA